MASVVIGLVMLVGLVGVVVPFLPGTSLVLGAGIAWALLVADDGTARWVVVALMSVLFVLGAVAKYALPGRMLSSRVPRGVLVVGAVGAVVGLFVFPPFGLLIGGVLGVFVAEVRQHGLGAEAWRSTVHVLKAVGLGVLAELVAGVLMVAAWLSGLTVA